MGGQVELGQDRTRKLGRLVRRLLVGRLLHSGRSYPLLSWLRYLIGDDDAARCQRPPSRIEADRAGTKVSRDCRAARDATGSGRSAAGARLDPEAPEPR